MRKYFKILRNFFLVLLGMIILMFVFINLTPVQNFIAQKTVFYLSEKLQTKIELQHIRLKLLNKVELQGLYIEDQKGDTLVYIGQTEMNITDWFIFYDKPVISFAGIKDAYFNLNRPEGHEIWNFQFAIDAFSNQEKSDKEKQPLSIDLRKLSLENVHFYMNDAWVGSDMEGEIGNMNLSIKSIDHKRKIIDIRSIKGDNFQFGLREYTGGESPPEITDEKYQALSEKTPFNAGNWIVNLKDLDLQSGRFFLEHPETEAPEGLFDAAHLDIKNIDIQATQLSITGDTIRADLKHLHAEERSGLTIKEMSGQLTVSPNLSECKNLYLETNHSVLTDYYAMRYNHFPDFTNYIEDVRMEARLDNAEIGIQDIAFFAASLKRFKDFSVKVNGAGSGTVERLYAKDLVIKDGISTLKGNLSMNGLPDIYKTFIDFKDIELNTSGVASYFYAPKLARQTIANFKDLNKVNFKGNFTGFITDFVAYGDFVTNLGNAKADINMKIPENGMASYSGSLAASDFDIGTLFKQSFVRQTTFSADLKGSGFEQKNVSLDVDGSIDHIQLYDYDYQNIQVKGELQKKNFDGYLNIQDPNISLDFIGNVNFADAEKHIYNFDADISFLDAQALNWTEQKLKARGKISSNFTGNNIDNFIGSALFYKLDILREGKALNIDSVYVESKFKENGDKLLNLNSNDLAASIYGDFSILSLPNSVQIFLSYYLPQYVTVPEHVNVDQKLKFELKTFQTDDLISIFNRDLKISENSTITGSLDIAEQELELFASFPFVAYKDWNIDSLNIDNVGNYSGLDMKIESGKILKGDELWLQDFKFFNRIFQDSSTFHLQSQGAERLTATEINGSAFTQNDSFYVKFLPSHFYLNNDKWDLLPMANDYQAIIAPQYVFIDNLILQSGQQSLTVNSKRQQEEGNSALIVLKNMELSLLNNLFKSEQILFEGKVNGHVTVKGILDKLQFEFDINTENVLINEDTIGIVNTRGFYDVFEHKLTLEKGLVRHGASLADFTGNLLFNPDSKEPIDARIQLKDANISWASPFLKGLVRDVTGTLNGEIKLSGLASDFKTQGLLSIKESGFTPEIIGVPYKIDDGIISIKDNVINIDTLILKDEFQNEAFLTGNITHKQLNNWMFRLRLNSDQIQVVNLKSHENEHFYGEVFSTVQSRITGPFDNLSMTVVATPTKNSKLFIPIAYDSDLGTYSYIYFKKEEEGIDFTVKKRNKLSFRLDAIVNPDIEATIMLDPNSGDRIWAKGHGNITLNIPADGEMKMNGNYIIDQGTYDFSFRQLEILNYKRQFTINPNSAIKWNGDVKNADLDVSGYATIKARLYDLIQSEVDRLNLSSQEVRDAQIMQNVNVLLNMNGSLAEPDMKFKIELVEGRSIGTYAYQKLQRINSDERELLNQVASLLLLEQFAPEGINNSAISSGTINNMSELISTAASTQITNLANKVLGVEDLFIGVRYKNYSLSSNNDINAINYFNRNEAGINLRKNFFNNRLQVEVGGVYDWGQAVNSSDFTSDLAGDFRVQYLLTEDGRIRFNVFRTSDYDALFGKPIGRQGVGIGYRKSFNGFKDLFQSSRKAAQVPSEILNPVIPKEVKEEGKM